MHDAPAVGFVERIGELQRDIEAIGHRQRTARDSRGQQFALDVLHGDEQTTVEFAEVVGHGDVRRTQEGCGLGLANQPVSRLRVRADLRRQKFQRDAAPQTLVFGKIDVAHSPAAQTFEHVIVENGGPDEPCARGHVSIIFGRLCPPSSVVLGCGVQSES